METSNNGTEKIFPQDLELKFVNKMGVVRIIKWGNDYLEWPLDRRLEYAEALASSMNAAVIQIEKERNAAWEEIEKIKQLNEHASKFAQISKETLVQSITESNEDKLALAKRISELEKEVRQLKTNIDAISEELEGCYNNC